MTTRKEVIDHIFAEPFRPFRVHTASGRDFEVRHPEVVQVGKSNMTIYAPVADVPDAEEKWNKPSLMLIESIEPLDVPASPAKT